MFDGISNFMLEVWLNVMLEVMLNVLSVVMFNVEGHIMTEIMSAIMSDVKSDVISDVRVCFHVKCLARCHIWCHVYCLSDSCPMSYPKSNLMSCWMSWLMFLLDFNVCLVQLFNCPFVITGWPWFGWGDATQLFHFKYLGFAMLKRLCMIGLGLFRLWHNFSYKLWKHVWHVCNFRLQSHIAFFLALVMTLYQGQWICLLNILD